MVKNLNDASVVVPLIKEYLEISVKNDDALVKLAAIVQRMMKDNNTGDGNYMLSDEEKTTNGRNRRSRKRPTTRRYRR